jgi:hypothetical protein
MRRRTEHGHGTSTARRPHRPVPIDELPWRPGGDANGVYESEASYRARLEAMPLADLLPHYQSTATGGDASGALVSATTAYVRDLGSPDVGQNLTTVALLNIGDTAGGPVATSTVAGFGGQLYASADSLYIAGSQWSDDSGPTTRLLKFQLAPDAVPLEAAGSVAGTVLDQFSMDDDGEHFRVATSGWDPSTGSPHQQRVRARPGRRRTRRHRQRHRHQERRATPLRPLRR